MMRRFLLVLGIAAVLFSMGMCAAGDGDDVGLWGALTLLGVALMWLGTRRASRRCPTCAEPIDAAAKRCVHCGAEVAVDGLEEGRTRVQP